MLYKKSKIFDEAFPMINANGSLHNVCTGMYLHSYNTILDFTLTLLMLMKNCTVIKFLNMFCLINKSKRPYTRFTLRKELQSVILKLYCSLLTTVFDVQSRDVPCCLWYILLIHD